jgi:hypothetical protein
MTQIVMLLAGIALILGTIGSFIWSVFKTPDHLRGYYGFCYTLIALSGLVGGSLLILFSLI